MQPHVQHAPPNPRQNLQRFPPKKLRPRQTSLLPPPPHRVDRIQQKQCFTEEVLINLAGEERSGAVESL